MDFSSVCHCGIRYLFNFRIRWHLVGSSMENGLAVDAAGATMESLRNSRKPLKMGRVEFCVIYLGGAKSAAETVLLLSDKLRGQAVL